MSASESASPGGQPSITQPIAGPWLSPKVVTVNSLPKELLDTGFGRPLGNRGSLPAMAFGCLPFARQQGEDHVVDPLASQPQAFAVMRLLAHAEPAQQRHAGQVARVHRGV